MSSSRIIAISGSVSLSSNTRVVLEDVLERLSERVEAAVEVIDIGEIAHVLGPTKLRTDAPAEIERLLEAVEGSDLILAGAPVYKGSYPGLFKHFIDLIDYRALVGRPVGLIATGGSDRHALVIEHQLRPLFGFFNARTLPTGVFISTPQHDRGIIIDPLVRARLDALVDEAVEALARHAVAA
ncbi:NAD(P)H-dependent oxidoreductase [Hansschlegelia plantiphila]|uniref:FMN reductase (NADPH) n=1 Tax=Hansschlegelia plantiphila TaxID=374655 RepID=A0A9W6J2Q7_9HYPH|nr:NAD(P)H-dependent oxidoreductase [Hansschlegelia plantiphila]GLK69780.1 FMN reductase (NADPH) [Hansschlegelia plantiphila]